MGDPPYPASPYCIVRFRMSDVRDEMGYFENKGISQQADEPTADFSDDEDSEDDPAIKRRRKETTGLLHETSARVRRRAVEKLSEFGQDVRVSELQVQDGQFGMQVFGVHDVTKARTAAQAIDPDLHTSLVETNDDVTDKATGTTRIQRNMFLMFEPEGHVRRFVASSAWVRYILLGAVPILVGIYCLNWAWQSLRTYF